MQEAFEADEGLFEGIKVEVALAREDDSEKAAVGRESEIADDVAAKDGSEVRLDDRNFVPCGGSCERRDRNPDEFGGFAFERAF